MLEEIDRIGGMLSNKVALRFLFWKCIMSMLWSVKPVSYTHLDVYKRQVLGYDNMNPIQVSISQFYGIEINDFAVTVAKTALWIAESQMMKETESIVYGWVDVAQQN